MLISAVTPFMSVYRLPQGQYGYRGHVINMPQDLTAFATSLPRLPSELDVMIVRKKGSNNTHRDFRVRRMVVQHAFQWLKQNNKYYRNISLNTFALSQLPEDGDLTDQCGVGIDDTMERDEEEGPPAAAAEEEEDPTDVATFIPVVARKMTEKETIRKSVHHKQQNKDQIVPWPENGSVPIDEFKTEGYISGAFPTLFPTGEADFLAPRQQSVTVGLYFKHLMMFKGGRFAKHPRFRYFALNTEMRWRSLQMGRVYINQHPEDARLTLDDLRDMVGREGEFFTNRVMHFASSLRGTSQFWFKQRGRLISMVDKLGMPTVFFTHSAADGQWPELAHLICPDNKDSSSIRSKAVADNPAIADWFFYHRISKFVDTFYTDVMGAVDYWYRFEWQHRGSPHVHGIAWFADAPDVQQLLAAEDYADLLTGVEDIVSYADSIVSTINPAISIDGSNAENAPRAQTKPHVCNKPYANVKDINMDLVEMIATCQRHTRCSPAYCLKKKKKGVQECRFGYPKPLQPITTINMEGSTPTLLTQRNDCLLNSYNPVQLSAWRANVDMQYIVSRNRVLNYIAKYAAKSEPRSKGLKAVYGNILKSMKDNGSSLKMVQKLMISSVGERDYSAQETCHLLMGLPMYRASRDFVYLTLDGSRQVDSNQEEGTAIVTLASQLDHYINRITGTEMEELSLLEFVQKFRMPKCIGVAPIRRKKEIVVIVIPYCSPDPQGPKYEQYCRQKLMLHQPFRHLDELLGDSETHSESYTAFLQSSTVPPSLADDIRRLEVEERENRDVENVEEVIKIMG